MSKYFPQINIRVIQTNKNTVGSVFKYKDVVPAMLRPSIIYEFCCGRCSSTSYVGSTTRPLYKRVAEHRGRSFCTGELAKNPKETAILTHGKNFSHGVGEENFKIIGSTKNEISLRILESLIIKEKKPNLNKNLSAFPLLVV